MEWIFVVWAVSNNAYGVFVAITRRPPKVAARSIAVFAVSVAALAGAIAAGTSWPIRVLLATSVALFALQLSVVLAVPSRSRTSCAS